jgi:hypothetical protein
VALDIIQVRGEGGPYDARLVLPLILTMYPRKPEEALALTELTCSLHLGMPAFDQNQVGPTVTMTLQQNMPCRSLSDRPNSHTLEVRVPLSQPVVAHLDAQRHTSADKAFTAVLRLSATVGWLYKIGNTFPSGSPEPQAIGNHPFSSALGLFSLVAPFWDTRIEPLPIRITAPLWIDNALPGLGYDRLRLIEVMVPSPGEPLLTMVIPFFDDARRDYDAGRYRECVQKCRDVRHAVEQHLGATGKEGDRVADKVAARLGLSADDPRRKLLDGMWQGLVLLTSEAHHISNPGGYTAANARGCLLLTATLLDYLRSLFNPPPIGLNQSTPRP